MSQYKHVILLHFFVLSLKSHGALCTYNSSPSVPATLQMVINHMWLMASVLESAGRDSVASFQGKTKPNGMYHGTEGLGAGEGVRDSFSESFSVWLDFYSQQVEGNLDEGKFPRFWSRPAILESLCLQGLPSCCVT